MTYILGKGSLRELRGVHPNLIKVVHRTIEITEQDFTVVDGLRTLEEQKEYVRTGVSWTLKSFHLQQEDGFGHAVDLVPYINGKVRWELEPCYTIARAVRQAALDEGVPILWGGCWQRLDGSEVDLGLMVEEYISKRRRQGRRPTVDGPHYQLVM